MNGEAIWIDCPGGRLRLNDFCRLFKVPYRTVQGRLKRGENTFEQLSRPPEPRFSKTSREKLRGGNACPINSLLAGWKRPATLTAFETANTRSANTQMEAA